ncbi:hypothetical protein [Bradyrhizobium sp. BR 1432]|uniref:hypothetical protein n=1 Tax=Bradyrhizobium sp. BR 1432 TaxID=3447966 RepID=UPI003EE6BAEE
MEVEKLGRRAPALLAPENGSAPTIPGIKLHILRLSEVVIPHRLRLDTFPHSKGAGEMMKLIAVVAGLLLLGMIGQANARGGHGGRVSYGGGHHTTSHGGSYLGGSGSSHRGGTYVNSRTGNRYGTHR